MTQPSPNADVLDLLHALHARVQAQPELAAEWLELNVGADASWGTPAARLEWFLLERVSPTLGSAPIQAWAPSEVEEDSAWGRLLDSFLGIFQVTGALATEGGQLWQLEDLWTGRGIQVPHSCLPEANPQAGDLLYLGRFVLTEEDTHAPLPGLVRAEAPELIAAVDADLALARHQQPRARLSQRECHALFAAAQAQTYELDPWQGQHDAGASEALQRLLEAAPGWTLERLDARLAEAGLSQTLDELAFETRLDLEELRRLLPAHAAARGTVEPSRTPPSGPTELRPEEISTAQRAAALAAFERDRAAGRSVADAFAELEQALGLEPGTSEEILPADADDSAAIGAPAEASGLSSWIEAYSWESADSPAPELGALAKLAEATAGRTLDAAELRAEHVLPFLMACASAEQLRRRREAIHGFLLWAAAEQEAPVGEALESWANPEDERLPALVEANRELAAADRSWTERLALVSLDPFQVSAGDGETARVLGLPKEVRAWLEPGDWVLGKWQEGRFEAAALMPAAWSRPSSG